jgi:hypothetical protein
MTLIPGNAICYHYVKPVGLCAALRREWPLEAFRTGGRARRHSPLGAPAGFTAPPIRLAVVYELGRVAGDIRSAPRRSYWIRLLEHVIDPPPKGAGFVRSFR